MTTRGTANLELSFLVESERVEEIGVENYTRGKVRFAGVGGCALNKAERDAVWLALPEWLQEKLLDEAAENAEPVDDDHGPEHVSGPVGRVMDGITVDAEGKVA
jgi:hypothetical protein